MPRESIYEVAGKPEEQRRRVEVSWGRDHGAVMLGSSKLADDITDPSLEFLPVAEGEEPRHAWEGQFLRLDRDQLNHLIRTLRKARDQAFGRDE